MARQWGYVDGRSRDEIRAVRRRRRRQRRRRLFDRLASLAGIFAGKMFGTSGLGIVIWLAALAALALVYRALS